MLISGITKFSLLDYPGKTSCIIFTPGCNLRCSYCYNPEFILLDRLKITKKNLIYEKAFFNFLDTRIGLLDGVSICGGEPTLHKDLDIFCEKIKKKGFLVKLDTNGQNPFLLKKLINEGLVDYIAMDVKNSLGNMSKITNVPENENKYYDSIDLILNSKINYEFRTTFIKGFHTIDDIVGIYKLISGAKNYYIQNFRTGNTLEVDFKGHSFTLSELEEFRKLGLDFVENIQIRG